mmetsp:Transcript_94135/g.186626  ORF Transcript_94135/g.186626 Transcript_94135/m.186626 type:complete len:96 (-) Transcript_94135:28-315(-)
MYWYLFSFVVGTNRLWIKSSTVVASLMTALRSSLQNPADAKADKLLRCLANTCDELELQHRTTSVATAAASITAPHARRLLDRLGIAIDTTQQMP